MVLHVSGDFPDPFEPFKTPVIRDLIELTREAFDHRVISINRVSPGTLATARTLLLPGKLQTQSQPFEHGIALRYTAPGKGIRHRTILEKLGERIAEQIRQMDRRPDLIVGHKLTIEGIAVRHAANMLGLPYALSIQGNTDTKILVSRPDLKRHLAQIFHEAKVVFPFTPWALSTVEAALGPRSGPTHLLPCPTELDQPMAPRTGGDGLISVFHLKNHANKNLTGMVEAFRQIARLRTPPPLAIVGGGTENELAACRALASDFEQVTFSGALGRDAMAERLNRATALVVPSLRESFGLVFIEALFAGLPIIYPAGTAVDGYFDDAPFAMKVDARDPASIAAAMEHAVDHEAELKAALGQWQRSDEAQRFTRASIAKIFSQGLTDALTP